MDKKKPHLDRSPRLVDSSLAPLQVVPSTVRPPVATEASERQAQPPQKIVRPNEIPVFNLNFENGPRRIGYLRAHTDTTAVKLKSNARTTDLGAPEQKMVYKARTFKSKVSFHFGSRVSLITRVDAAHAPFFALALLLA